MSACVEMTDPPRISNPIKAIAQAIAVTSDTEIKKAHNKDANLERGEMARSAPVPKSTECVF